MPAHSSQTLLLDRASQVRDAYHRLVLLVGGPRSGKTERLAATAASTSWPRINMNLELSERLLDLTVKQRNVRVPALVDDILRATVSDVVLLDNLEILFSEDLALDPLRLLQSLSRNRTIIAAWPGSFDGDVLTYAEPAHREFRKYSRPQVAIVRTFLASSQPAEGAE